MLIQVNSLDEFNRIISDKEAALFYFSHDACSVCKVLSPKIAELLSNRFPKISMFYIDTEKSPEISAQNRIFTVPTLTVYFDGKEFLRRSRNIGIGELEELLSRPYQLMFE